VLGLGLWGLEGAGEDDALGIVDLLGHLGVRELFVDDDTLNERGVLDGTTGLGDDLDQFEVNISTFEIGNVKDGLEGEISEVILALGDDLRSEGGGSALSEFLVIVFLDVEVLLDLLDSSNSDLTSLVETISDLQGVNTLLEELLGLLKDGSGQNNNTGGTVTDFVILRGGKLGQKFGGLMVNLHLLEDSGTIVSDDDLTVGADHEFIHTLGAKGGLHHSGNSSGSHDVNLMSLEALNSLLLVLLSEDDEGSTVFVVS